MWYNLLSDAAASASNSAGDTPAGSPWPIMLMFGVIVAVAMVFSIYSRRTQMKRQQDAMEALNAIQPGNKVKTIGGICGVVVEVCPEDNTFVLETGSDVSGKSYLKLDKQAIYQSDAVVKKEEPVAEMPAEEPFAEETVEATEAAEEPATEEVVEETSAEE